MPPAIERVAIVGGGLAGLRAVEMLRRGHFAGWIGLIGEEQELPYDRPPLSKEVLTAPDEPPSTVFRGAEQMAAQGVDVRLGATAVGLDLEASALQLDGETLPFDGLIIATGARPRNLLRLASLDNVFTLRTREDAHSVREALRGARSVVVIGAGFIGGEVAASARSLGLEVTIVETETAPLSRVLGLEIGATVIDLHHEHGTRLMLGAAVVDGEQTADGGVRLTLDDGAAVEADLVVVGIGVVPNTDWLEGSGLELGNGVVCDASLNAGYPGVFAVGDVANWPNPLFDRRMRVEHWTNAIGQGRHAARNLLEGDGKPFEGSNYFWSDQYGIRLQFAGVSSEEVEIIDGSVEERKFLAWFTEGDRLVGAFAMGGPESFMVSRGLIEERSDRQAALRELA